MVLLRSLWRRVFGSSIDSLDLAQIVKLAADHPTRRNQDAFVRKLLVSNVGVRIAGVNRQYSPGECIVVGPDDKIMLSVATGPDGTQALLVIPNLPVVAATMPEAPFGEMTGVEAIKVASKLGVALVVQDPLDPSKAYAGVDRERVMALASQFP